MMACPKCGVTGLMNMRSLVTHLVKRHGNEPKFSISCNLRSSTGHCCAIFRSVGSYKTHLYRYHKNTEAELMQTEIQCSECITWHSSLAALSAHYKRHCEDGKSIICVVKHCNFMTESHSSYRAHMSRVHRNMTVGDIKINLKRQVMACESEMQEEQPHSSEQAEFVHEGYNDVDDESTVKQNIALMFLKMKSQYSLPNSTVQSVVEDFRQVLEMSSMSMLQEIENVCAKYDVPHDVLNAIRNVCEESTWKKAFQELSTDWRRTAYYKQEFPYVAPVEYKFSEDILSSDSFQYIPLLNTIEQILVNNSIRSQLVNPPVSLTGHLSTFKDGTRYKNHTIFSKCEISLEIVLYSDEFQVVNPLGPHTKKHKMFAVYFTLGNLHSTCKAQKSSMFLLLLCKSTAIQRHGFNRLAEVINKDIAVLETEGIDVEGYAQKLRGAVAFIAGDNLNSHLIGGFNASFSPNVTHPCRFCMISNTQLQEVFDADIIQVRTPEDYDRQVREVQADASMSKVYGIRNNSSFVSGTFHVIDGLPPDIMHDLLEGVVPFELALCLKEFLDRKYFTLEQLNNIISSWTYGPLDKDNKPVVISTSFGETVKQNAGRMWCLLRLLPLMVGSKVPADDAYWKFFVQLKEIVEMVFAPQLAVGHVILLQQCIQNHLATFHELFPNRLLKPKQHFLLHYPRFFLLYGPLRACWCMRFESKHFYFTHLMRIVNNYKNACATLAERHQMKLAYLLIEGTNFLEQPVSLSSTKLVDMSYLSEKVVEALLQASVERLKPLHKCKFVKVNGILYYCNMHAVLMWWMILQFLVKLRQFSFRT